MRKSCLSKASTIPSPLELFFLIDTTGYTVRNNGDNSRKQQKTCCQHTGRQSSAMLPFSRHQPTDRFAQIAKTNANK